MVGTAYFITAIVFFIAAPTDYALLAVIAPVPGAIIWFFYTRFHFRKAWFDDEDSVPDGVELANDSWQDGLLYLSLAALAGIALFLFKFIRSGLLG